MTGDGGRIGIWRCGCSECVSRNVKAVNGAIKESGSHPARGAVSRNSFRHTPQRGEFRRTPRGGGELEYEHRDDEKAFHLHIPTGANFSPALAKLLKPDCKIICFQNCFRLLEWKKKDNEFLQWVYGRTDIEYEYLPENTSLQRNMKKYLLQGGRIGAGRGILMKFD